MGCGTKSLPKQWKSVERVEIPTAAVWKSLPKQWKSVERVEIPSGAVRKSLPNQRKTSKKVENPRNRRPEISTQKAKKPPKR